MCANTRKYLSPPSKQGGLTTTTLINPVSLSLTYIPTCAGLTNQLSLCQTGSGSAISAAAAADLSVIDNVGYVIRWTGELSLL